MKNSVGKNIILACLFSFLSGLAFATAASQAHAKTQTLKNNPFFENLIPIASDNTSSTSSYAWQAGKTNNTNVFKPESVHTSSVIICHGRDIAELITNLSDDVNLTFEEIDLITRTRKCAFTVEQFVMKRYICSFNTADEGYGQFSLVLALIDSHHFKFYRNPPKHYFTIIFTSPAEDRKDCANVTYQ